MKVFLLFVGLVALSAAAAKGGQVTQAPAFKKCKVADETYKTHVREARAHSLKEASLQVTIKQLTESLVAHQKKCIREHKFLRRDQKLVQTCQRQKLVKCLISKWKLSKLRRKVCDKYSVGQYAQTQTMEKRSLKGVTTVATKAPLKQEVPAVVKQVCKYTCKKVCTSHPGRKGHCQSECKRTCPKVVKKETCKAQSKAAKSPNSKPPCPRKFVNQITKQVATKLEVPVPTQITKVEVKKAEQVKVEQVQKVTATISTSTEVKKITLKKDCDFKKELVREVTRMTAHEVATTMARCESGRIVEIKSMQKCYVKWTKTVVKQCHVVKAKLADKALACIARQPESERFRMKLNFQNMLLKHEGEHQDLIHCQQGAAAFAQYVTSLCPTEQQTTQQQTTAPVVKTAPHKKQTTTPVVKTPHKKHHTTTAATPTAPVVTGTRGPARK